MTFSKNPPRAAWVLLLLAGAGCTPTLRIHSNQIGYLPQSTKVAVVEAEQDAAAEPWELVSGGGETVASGVATVHGPDSESGQFLHHVDFTHVVRSGQGYRLRVGADESHPFAIGPRVYQDLKYDALAFFYHNRSGLPIEQPYVTDEQWTRRAGHLSDRHVPYVGGEQKYELDVSGGWYDAGDHGKYVVNGGIASWTLLNLFERTQYLGSTSTDFGDGRLSIPERNNGVPDLLDEVRYELEFLLKMQVPRGLPQAGMAHHKIHDGSWTAIPFLAPTETDTRYLHRPSTAATLNLAATAAQAARIWKKIDPEFSQTCLRASMRAWNAARRYPDWFASSADSQGGGPYDDSTVDDEFYWAAAELYLALPEAKSTALLAYLRKNPHHREFSLEIGHERDRQHTSMTWQGTAALGAISLAVVPSALPSAERERLRQGVVRAADAYFAFSEWQGYQLPMRAASDGHYPWGSNSFVANNAIVLALAHDFTKQPKYLDGVVRATDYLLGKNPLGLSYVTGHGSRPIENPHHRFWAHSKAGRFPPPPPGVLAGGPNSKLQDPTSGQRLRGCKPLLCYIDHIEAWSVNEVAINWNAPLAWVAAYLDEQGQRGGAQ